jgi:hypothetical protein
MIYRILADFLVVFHVAFLLFVVFGGLLALWRRRFAFLHLPAAVWGVFIELSGGICPLTPLEVRFRIQGGEAGYAGSFMDRYVVPVLYPPGLTRNTQIGLGILVGILNLGMYALVLWRWWREGRGAGGRGDAAVES